MRVGYSFWGFLGDGVTDTPDGGRSHRGVLIDGLRARGHQVIFLQANRDLLEAGQDLGDYLWDDGLPDLDGLFCEWRWPIPGRNDTECGSFGHTCDLHRQQELIDHYTRGQRSFTIVWDKDRQLPSNDPLRGGSNVAVCEAALFPEYGATSLLFPVDDRVLDAIDPAALAALDRPVDLSYVGNRYDRDEAFDRYFAAVAPRYHHLVAGKWVDVGRWPTVNFTGRVAFQEVERIYRESLATVLLLPERYCRVGQMTQRIFEAVTRGCLPITPREIRGAERFSPADLLVDGSHDVERILGWAGRTRGTEVHADLIARCVDRLHIFRLSHQLDVVEELLTRSKKGRVI